MMSKGFSWFSWRFRRYVTSLLAQLASSKAYERCIRLTQVLWRERVDLDVRHWIHGLPFEAKKGLKPLRARLIEASLGLLA